MSAHGELYFGYVGVACFEACAFPTIISYIFPGFLKGYLYTVAGFDIYASWLALASVTAALMTFVNIMGAKTAAIFQTILTAIIFGVGVLLIGTSTVRGDMGNLMPQLFAGKGNQSTLSHVMHVAVMTPFFFIGFDVIPQAAEEIQGSLKKIGKILIMSIVMAVAFYSLVILAVGYMMSSSEINASMSGAGLVTADAMAKAYGTKKMAGCSYHRWSVRNRN